MSVLCLGKLRRGSALALLFTAFVAACGVPDYNLQGPTEGGQNGAGGAGLGGAFGTTGGNGTTGTTDSTSAAGGVTAITSTAAGGSVGLVDGGSTVATGGQPQQDPFNCRTSSDCSTFPATNVCDTSVNRCVECLPSVTACDDGLYCGTDKICHVGCAANTDCGSVVDCDASNCNVIECDKVTHECKGCTTDLDCKPGTVCEPVTGNCVSSCGNSSTCPAGWTCCAQGCVNLLSDTSNCASCGTTCDKPGANAQCLNGTCRIDCKENYLDCNQKYSDGCEVDKLSDSANCGACGVVCTGTQMCRNGTCADPVCGGTAYADCDNNAANGCETNIDSNVQNCGSCNLKCSTTNGVPTCSGGQCAITCSSGFGDCDKRADNGCEVNLSTTAASCGACGAACTNDHGTSSCTDGKCVPTCGTGFADCDGNPANGCEATKTTDMNNCGACGNVCNPAHATAACTSGACTIASCADGFADCNHDPADGCESQIQSDTKNCGVCGTACNTTNGAATCVAGACAIACTPDFDNCDKDAANGCEANLKSSVSHCGSCATVCQDQPNGTATCVNGECGVSNCQAPFGDCDTYASTGCEANENTDPKNCGGCGVRCSIPNATAVCTLGVCGVGTCNDGFADCNGDPKDGCEVNVKADTNNCSACGSKCAPANAVGSCVNGACSITSCQTPYQDCNKAVSDGCEANTTTNVSNCGTCGSSCDGTHGTPSCAYGVCGITCAPGFGDCDGDAKNGCESSTTSDALHCGSCVNSCTTNNAALGSCVNSNCNIGLCSTGFADCNGKYSDGCEARLINDASNCGSCGNICSSANGTATCANNACSIICLAGFGNCDTLASTGCEINITSNLANCGGCGTACAPANATGSCAGNVCTGTCMTGFGNCDANWANGCESNLMTDTNQCGTCGTKCTLANATAICNGGRCAIGSCNTGFLDCNGDPADGCEVNKTADPTHCGSCSTVCSTTNGAAVCTSGVCGINCTTGFGNCDNDATNGCEINLAHDVLHCGTTCANATACSTSGGNRICNAGVCGYDSCAAPLATCSGGACATNLSTDVNNCSACGTKCSFSNAAASCVSSVCTLGTCTTNFGNCDANAANGCESSLKTDVNNCGACSAKCNLANATAVCTNGACAIASCNAGYYDCDGVASNGCEVNLKTDVNNCNACNTKCSATNGTASCTNGVCGITCSSGYDNCDGSVANGCEVNLKTSPTHCGSCSTVCNGTNGTATCSNGACGISCSTGYGNCDGNLANGCETNTTNNVNYCGNCSTVCNSANGTASCTSGTCGITCNSGYGNCDGNAANGCEAAYASNAAHCGNCTTACTYANATGVCSSGICQLGSCNANYGNCDNSSATGCEASTTSTSNCLTCGVACTNGHGTTTCSGTGCTPTCAAGYASCDSNLNNGCEQVTSNDVNHCGSCTGVCSYANATPTCTNGSCAMGACTNLYGDCNSSTTDGCETSLSANITHCGTCATACSSNNGTPSCASGACSISCNAGYSNCNTSVTDGCEVNLTTDTNNCGTCGHVCALGCENGICKSPCSTYSDCTSAGKSITVLTSAPSGFKPSSANICYEYSPTGNLAGGNCANFGSSGTMSVNGQSMTCNNSNWTVIPAKNNGGYCFHAYNVWAANASTWTTW